MWITPATAMAQGGDDGEPAADEKGAGEAPPPEEEAAPELSQDQADLKTEKADADADKKPGYEEGDLRATIGGEKEGQEPVESKERGEDDHYGHAMQFGIRAAIVGGYRVIFRYDDSPFCKEPDPNEEVKDQQSICGHMGPPAVDVALSFAPLDSVEPYLWGRFGLGGEAETNTNSLRIIGAGLRFYAASDSRFKFFIEPALGVELEDGGGNDRWGLGDLDGDGQPDDENYQPEWATDFLFHLGLGPQYDFAKAFGAYLHLGMNVAVLRSIHSTLDFGGGIQIRVP